jgi:two-component system C4-dicarboxylate transport response regulator DctD
MRGKGTETNGGPGRRVLVVDDNLELADNLAEMLVLAGYVAVVAGSAEEAFPLALDGGLCFVLTDYRLPGRSGADLIRDLRGRGWKIPAALMSAYTDESTIATAHAAGIVEFIPKPVDFRHLAEVIGVAAA